MKGKDFSGINTGRTYTTIERSTSKKGQQGTASEQEQAERSAELRTQGRKGCKATRINMAFTPENHDYIKTMARVRAQTLTEFCNYVVEQYRLEHKDLYEKAKAFITEVDQSEEES